MLLGRIAAEEEALYLTSFYKVRKEKQHELKITTYIISN
jgi:hypothetical protein